MIIRNYVFLFVFFLCCSCGSQNASQVANNDLNLSKDSLTNRSLGTFELDGVFKALDFHRAVVGLEPPRLTIPSIDSMLYEITISDTGLSARAICEIGAYHKFFSHTFEDCSSLHIDVETGIFSHYLTDTSITTWSFSEHAPQVIPNQGMEVHKNRVYILNSSYSHNVSQAEDARTYHRDIRPIVSFRLDDPTSTDRTQGSFPSFYSDAEKSVGDYQPLFCVNTNLQCVLSFRYSDSLYFTNGDADQVKAVSCKSDFYIAPDFLSFEESKSMTSARKFDDESSMYLWVKYNPIRDEYYRFCKHALDKDGKSAYSILVLDAQMNQTAEFTFNSEEYGLVPLVSTKEGFMVINIQESKLKRKYCFEKFRV